MRIRDLKELARIVELAQDIREESFKPNEDTQAFFRDTTLAVGMTLLSKLPRKLPNYHTST